MATESTCIIPIQRIFQFLSPGGYLLGDAAYPLLPWLLTPYRDNKSVFPPWQKRFNSRLSEQRIVIEHSFGILKQRFQKLYMVDADTPLQICLIVMGCCVLHNMCLGTDDVLDDLHDYVVENDDDVPLVFGTGASEAAEHRYSDAQREKLARNLK